MTQTSITLIKNRPKGVNSYDVNIKQSETVVATVQTKLDIIFCNLMFLQSQVITYCKTSKSVKCLKLGQYANS